MSFCVSKVCFSILPLADIKYISNFNAITFTVKYVNYNNFHRPTKTMYESESSQSSSFL